MVHASGEIIELTCRFDDFTDGQRLSDRMMWTITISLVLMKFVVIGGMATRLHYNWLELNIHLGEDKLRLMN